MSVDGSSGSIAPDPAAPDPAAPDPAASAAEPAASDPGDHLSGPGVGRRPSFALIVSITITGIMANTLITPVAPDIVADFGVGPTGLGLLLGAATAPGILLAPVIGVLADRFGRRALLLPCLVVFGLSGGLAVVAPSFPVLVALRVGQGLGSAGLINLAVVLIGDHWDGLERARMIGRNAAALTIALAVLPPLGGLLGDLGGWRASFVPYWVALGTATLVYRRLPASPRGDRTIGQQLRDMAPHLRSPAIAASLGVGFVFFVVIFGLILTVLPVHLATDFGASASTRGFVLGMPAITSTVVAFNLGRLRDWLGRRWLLVGGCVALSGALLVLAGAPTFALVLLAPPIYGLAEGVLIPTLQDVVTGEAPTESRGALVAIWVGVARLGQTIGPVLAGAGLEVVSSGVLFTLGAAAAGLLALGLAVARIPARATA